MKEELVFGVLFFFCAFHEMKKEAKETNERKLLRNEQEKSDICARRKTSKEGCYVYLKVKDYHFDRQWKELERPNASFEGRTTHPIIRSVENNTAVVDRILFKFSDFSYLEEKISHTDAIIAKTRTHTANYY